MKGVSPTKGYNKYKNKKSIIRGTYKGIHIFKLSPKKLQQKIQYDLVGSIGLSLLCFILLLL